MKLPQDIILKPHFTEKSNMDAAFGKYTFVVAVNATKPEIRSATEKLFGVKVVSVRTMNYDGKIKRMGVHQGPRASWKKAIVTIDLDPKPETYIGKGGKETTTGKKYKTSIAEFGVAE